MTHYRLPLFERLRADLLQRGVSLEVLVGKGTEDEERKSDAGVLPWAQPLTTLYVAGGRLCLQPLWNHLHGADLVVVTQENKLLYNHWLTFGPRRFKLAFWGHGANLQSDHPNGYKERFKRWTTNKVDWWFAYTQISADLVRCAGFPKERITVLNNAVDTSELQRQRESVTHEEMQTLRKSLGFGQGRTGVFVGSLYAEKRLDFLFQAAESIRHQVPDFQLLLLGDGPERDKVQAWCEGRPWVRWVGAKFGRDKVACVLISNIMLNPGLVGLGILDSFVCGVPLITTDCGIHSPEIAYLDHGKNGLQTPDSKDAYVQAVVDLLRDEQALVNLQEGCFSSSRQYTVENMVKHFSEGIEQALSIKIN
jgi:L-malate glycosyltransferase